MGGATKVVLVSVMTAHLERAVTHVRKVVRVSVTTASLAKMIAHVIKALLVSVMIAVLERMVEHAIKVPLASGTRVGLRVGTEVEAVTGVGVHEGNVGLTCQ